MKKLNGILILTVGILFFLISYNFDSQVSLFFKNIRFPILDAILGIITNFGVVTILMLIVPSLILYNKNKKIVYLLLATFAASIISALIIKLIVLRQRPIEGFAYPFTNIINYSFPSMHAMVVFSLLPILIKYVKRQRYIWIFFASLVGFSRVYFRFHFLSDVVFGALFGYFIGYYLLELFKRKWK